MRERRQYWPRKWNPTEEEWRELARSKKNLIRMRDNSLIALVDNENRLRFLEDELLDLNERLKRHPRNIDLMTERQKVERRIKQVEKDIEFYAARAEKANQLLREEWNFESQTTR